MDVHSELVPLLAFDARFSIDAYIFVFEALAHTKSRRIGESSELTLTSTASNQSSGSPRLRAREHLNGTELCYGAVDLLLARYGLLAKTIAETWGIHTTSDLGDIVYRLIASGDLEATETDSRSDFENVFVFKTELESRFRFENDDLII
jgi:uncharacterized repeat protein (TIGR04138 family)